MEIKLDEGYFFGLGFFETLHIYKGEALFLEEHLERINNSLKIFGINKTIKKETVKNYIRENNKTEEWVLKIVVSEENTLFLCREYSYIREQYDKGFKVNLSTVRKNNTSQLVSHKSLNYGDNILEKRRSKSLNYDEPIFLNSFDALTEGATTNIFLIKGNKIFTPTEDCGILKGIVRNYILSNFDVEEKIIYKEEIESFEEVFLTNSLLGVMPVKSIANIEFSKRTTTMKIMKKYEQYKKNALKKYT